jgi:dolichol-phosphate mannosyltransferase
MNQAVVVATYNELKNAPELARRVRAVMPDVRLVFVDDNSPDGTAEALRALGDARLEVVVRTGARGYGTAVRDGLLHAIAAGAEAVATMDADLSHDPADLPALFAALEGGADVAIGSRYRGGVRVINWPLKRLVLSLFANRYVNAILRLGPEDCTSGFRAYRAGMLAGMGLQTIRSNGYSFLVEMLWRAKCRAATITEVPIIFTERREGESKMSGAVIRESILMPWRLRLGRMRG